ncbi:MAG TPA: mechanosensitive ion channel [Candidatus Syntrophosphaera sp.]|nr:mechanosensitive ion channel [Candidatus Syntrophosphaera sp.]
MNINWEELPGKLGAFGIKLAIALVIFFIGNWIAKAIGKMGRNMMLKRKADNSIATFIGNIVYAILLLIVVLSALSVLGVNTSSFMVIVGAAVLAIGMAMQGTLGQFASGVMLIGLRPFKIGDAVIAGGQTGTVHDIGILSTTILTSDNKKIIVPNSAIAGGAITNFSAMPTRRVELAIVVPGATDLNKGRDILKGILDAESRILKDPAPSIAIADASAAEIKYGIAAHVNNADLGAVQASLLENIKQALTAAGIWA